MHIGVVWYKLFAILPFNLTSLSFEEFPCYWETFSHFEEFISFHLLPGYTDAGVNAYGLELVFKYSILRW